MSAWPDALPLRAFLTRAARRVRWIAAAESVAIGLAVALAIATAAWLGDGFRDRSPRAGILLAGAGLLIGLVIGLLRDRRIGLISVLIEGRAPACHNLIITAAELIDQPTRVRPQIGEAISRAAVRLSAGLNPTELFPARRAVGALGTTIGLWALALVLMAAHPGRPRTLAPPSIESAIITGVDVVITPPAYMARPAETERDPARIEALAGSRIRLSVTASAGGVTIETLNGRQTANATGAGTFVIDLRADADGYIAIEPTTSGGREGVRRLIGLSVTADQPPRVRLTAPGRDLFIADSNRTIDLALEADDDIGLTSLQVRYTKVSGSGEQFTFTEGEVPLEITRSGPRNWNARGTWHLGTLGLGPGDMVVYRAVAADGRPGAIPSESDSYIVEITAPGSVAAEGFAADDQLDKYALSEQMVILKTEKLIATHGIPADSLSDASLGLAAEQRGVRAVFVFMMGGELSDEAPDVSADPTAVGELHEEGEAAGESDLAAGRMANQGRIALVQALRSMSRAATSLVASDLTQALVDEKAALTSLQGAFSRTRYILRALTERESLDLTRRMSGVLAAAGRDAGPRVDAAEDPRVAPLRHALAGIATLAGEPRFTDDASIQASRIAESVLRVDPSAPALQQVAARLTEALREIHPGTVPTDQTRTLFDRAATDLAAAVRADLRDAPGRATPLDIDRIDGALIDALRRPKGAR